MPRRPKGRSVTPATTVQTAVGTGIQYAPPPSSSTTPSIGTASNNSSNNNLNHGASEADTAEAMAKHGSKMIDKFRERERTAAVRREFSDTLYTIGAGQSAYLRPGFTLDDLPATAKGAQACYEAFNKLRAQEHAVDSILERTRGVQHGAYLDDAELFFSLKSAPAKTLKVIVKSRVTSQTAEMPFRVAVSIEAQLFSSFAASFSGAASLPPQTPAFARRLDLSKVFKRVVVAADGGVSEWTPAQKQQRVGAFVFRAVLSTEQDVKVLLELNQTPRVYKLSNQLAQLAHGPTATMQSLISLLWDYGSEYKLFEFNPVTAGLTLTCDGYLASVFSYPVGEKIQWKGVERHILPALTEQPPLVASIPVGFSAPENVVSFVVPLMYDSHNENPLTPASPHTNVGNRNGVSSSTNNNGFGGNNNNNNNSSEFSFYAGGSSESVDGNTAAVTINENGNCDVENEEGDDDSNDEAMDSDDDDYIGEEFYESTLKSVGSNSNNNNKGGSGTDSRPKVETVADAARYFRQHKQSPFDVSEDRTVASAQLRSLDDRLDKVFAEIRERLARRKLYLEFARTPSVAAAKVTTALLRDRGIATANISGRNPDEIRKSSFYKSHSPYMNRTVKAYLSVPMEKRRHKN